ncbi:MAG: bifunctional DNA primase/polymerase [Alphaproteobacteria bacterium]|nr:bifunctional DNA primase/polymerase [Alphaproteobacteria bacterium]
MIGKDEPTASALARAAIDYAARGLRPVPMITQFKRPALRGWATRANCDPDAVAAFFARAPFATGLAIATGQGVLVLDLDCNHENGVNGLLSFAALCAEHGAGEALALGPRVRTPRNGLHIYFRYDRARAMRNRVGLAPGVDVRGERGLAMAPPSYGYRWVFDSWAQELPPAPEWLLALLDPPPRPPVSATYASVGGLGSRITSVSAYASAVFERELAAVAKANRGERNQTLFKASARTGSLASAGMLPVERLEAALLEAAVANGLVADKGEEAAQATIASGLKRGLANPRRLLDRQ